MERGRMNEEIKVEYIAQTGEKILKDFFNPPENERRNGTD